jgi:hypothetical protein
MSPRTFSARLLAALVCAAVLVAGSAATAGATAARTAPVTGQATFVAPDGTCPPFPPLPDVPVSHVDIQGTARTRLGPAKLKMFLCELPGGPMGEALVGRFSLVTFAGTLSGPASGSLAFGSTNGYSVTLTVEQGSFLLSTVTGTLSLTGTAAHTPSAAFSGALTSDLHLSFRGHSLPFPLI